MEQNCTGGHGIRLAGIGIDAVAIGLRHILQPIIRRLGEAQCRSRQQDCQNPISGSSFLPPKPIAKLLDFIRGAEAPQNADGIVIETKLGRKFERPALRRIQGKGRPGVLFGLLQAEGVAGSQAAK